MRAPRTKRRLRFLSLSLALAGTCMAPTLAQETPDLSGRIPSTQKSPTQLAADVKKAATAAVNLAIVDLTQELTAHQKDSKSPLREKSNYFLEKKSPGVNHEEILAAMNRSSLGAGVAADTYIKWQLLSGIQGKVEDKLVSKLLSAYASAPLLYMRPGLEHASRRQLDAQIRNAAQNDAAKLSETLQKEVDAVAHENAPILVYREDLYAHLPGSGDAILAGLEDGAARAANGIDADRHMKGVMAQITTWSVSGTPPQIHAISGLLKSMIAKMSGAKANAGPTDHSPIYADVVGAPIYLAKGPPAAKPAPPKPAFPPSYYTVLEWDPKAKHLVWKEGAARFPDVKALTAMCQQLDDTAAVLAQMKSK